MTLLRAVSRYEKFKWDQIHIQFSEFWHTTRSRVYLELATIFIPNILVYSDMMSYPLVNSYRLFREACCIHLKGISSHAFLVGWLDPVIGGSKLSRNVGKYLYQYLTRNKRVL
jgi:hypothetical protein